MTRTSFHVLAAASVLAVSAPTVRAEPPAPVQASVPSRIEIRTPTPPPPEALQAAVRAIEGEPREGKRALRVDVRVTADGEKGSVARIDVAGDTIPADKIADAVRGSSPALAGADVSVQVVQASVDPGVASLVGPNALRERLTPEQIEQEVRARLAAQGVQGDVKVDVKTAETDGKVRHEVKVIVEKKEEAGAKP